MAFEEIVSLLGSPTEIPPPAFTFFRHLVSDSRSKVCVAPVSCMGVCVMDRFKNELWARQVFLSFAFLAFNFALLVTIFLSALALARIISLSIRDAAISAVNLATMSTVAVLLAAASFSRIRAMANGSWSWM